MNNPANIYKPCDIRGSVQRELTPALYRCWGHTLARLADGGPIVVGGDVRASTPAFLESLVLGLFEAGGRVVDLGLLPTPMIYFAKRHTGARACAIVTASHNPADINGLKWMIGDRPANQRQVDALQAGAQTEPTAAEPKHSGDVQRIDIGDAYLDWLKSTFTTARFDGRVVLDPMSGCWAGRAAAYLKAVFPALRIEALHDAPAGDFGGRMPDCSRSALLEELSRTVRSRRADLGIAFDGDGDRIALVDGDGVPLSPEQGALVLLGTFQDELRGQPFVHDLKFSDRVAEAAASLGATPLAERSGHAFIRTRMLDSNARFGAEVSGHYFYRELDGGDDALYTACRVIGHLGRSGGTLADLRRACPTIHMTPDLRVSVPSEMQQRILQRVRQTWADCPQGAIDGVRVDFPEGWALVRCSVTEAALTFRFEATGQEQLTALVRRFRDALPEIADPLWDQYHTRSRGTSHE